MLRMGNEIWKTYPEFTFIQGSNLGRVRTIDRFVKTKNGLMWVDGRVLKQRPDKGGYMHVSFKNNGKWVTRLVHRIIAACFISNPNNLEQINHKNCIRDDNCVENLEWCSASYNQQYRERYGVSMTESQGHSLWAVNLRTHKILYFRSQSEAGRRLGIKLSNINNVIKGHYKYAGGYWFTEDKNEITDKKLQEIKSNIRYTGEVFVVSLKTEKILHFKSPYEASRQLGISQSGISNVLSGHRKIAYGYWFAKDEDKITEDELRKNFNNMRYEGGIFAINLKTLEVSQFKSQTEGGRKLGIENRRINSVLKGNQNKTHGYWFTNMDENAVKNAKAKFGNKVAQDVKELMEIKIG